MPSRILKSNPSKVILTTNILGMRMGFRGMKAISLISSLFNKNKPEAFGLDGFPVYSGTPFKEAHVEINEYIVREKIKSSASRKMPSKIWRLILYFIQVA